MYILLIINSINSINEIKYFLQIIICPTFRVLFVFLETFYVQNHKGHI